MVEGRALRWRHRVCRPLHGARGGVNGEEMLIAVVFPRISYTFHPESARASQVWDAIILHRTDDCYG